MYHRNLMQLPQQLHSYVHKESLQIPISFLDKESSKWLHLAMSASLPDRIGTQEALEYFGIRLDTALSQPDFEDNTSSTFALFFTAKCQKHPEKYARRAKKDCPALSDLVAYLAPKGVHAMLIPERIFDDPEEICAVIRDGLSAPPVLQPLPENIRPYVKGRIAYVPTRNLSPKALWLLQNELNSSVDPACKPNLIGNGIITHALYAALPGNKTGTDVAASYARPENATSFLVEFVEPDIKGIRKIDECLADLAEYFTADCYSITAIKILPDNLFDHPENIYTLLPVYLTGKEA